MKRPRLATLLGAGVVIAIVVERVHALAAPDAIWFPHWDYTQMIRDLLDSDELWAHYPDVFTYGLALRKDGPRAATLRALVERSFGEDHPGLRLDDQAAARGE